MKESERWEGGAGKKGTQANEKDNAGDEKMK